jgi:hypothetical protein
MTKREPVIWRGELVGHISDISGDMFDLYGTWTAGAGAATQSFVERLRAGEQLWVEVGTTEPITRGTVEEEPMEQINIRMRSGRQG